MKADAQLKKDVIGQLEAALGDEATGIGVSVNAARQRAGIERIDNLITVKQAG